MTKFNKKARAQLKDVPYRPGDHGYGQASKSLQRYNATLGCFEEVPRPGALTDGSEAGPDGGAAPRRSRMKVMVKPYTNEEGEVLSATPASLQPLQHHHQQQQRVVRYEEVVEDDGQVVVHVPDSAAGPDGVIRLLQVTNEDGSVHYISAEHTELEEEDFTMEDAMQMIMTEPDVIPEQQGTAGDPPPPAAVRDTQAQQAATDAAREPTSVKDETGDPDLLQPAPICGACYVCGQPTGAGGGDDGPLTADDGPLTPLMTGRSRHTGTPLAELLADTVQRELTVSTADGVCAACLTLLDQCDQLESPLRKSAVRHVRNVLSLRVGDLSAIDVGDGDRKRGRSRVGWPTGVGPTADPQWQAAPGKASRRPRDARPWSPVQEEPKLEHLTDLTVPSETKRSARIAIRKNAFVANAVHATNKARVLVVPELHAKYLADPPAQRRPYRRVNMNPAKGRRGRPKLPDLSENELPSNLVTVDSELAEKPPDVEPDDPGPVTAAEGIEGAGVVEEEVTTPQETAADPAEERPAAVTDTDRLMVEEDITSQESNDSTTSSAPDSPAADFPDTLEPPVVPAEDNPDVQHIYIDVHEAPKEPDPDLEWIPTPGCTCIMCTDLTDEQRARLEMDYEFYSTFICQFCGRELVGRDRYKRHEAKCKERQLRPLRRHQPLTHECNTCGLTFKSARLRDEHYAESGHEKRHPCPVCFKFFHPDFLRIHLSSHSGAFHCRICDTHFSSKATLKGHMYRHSGLKPHKCDVCSMAFRTPSSLFMHKRYHHSDERPYVCNFCPKGFAARSTLRIHLRQHTGERPFACKLCPKSYTRKSSLTQHLRSHTQERRHVCMTCGKRFDNKTYLKVHMNRHLGIRAHPCGRCGRAFYSRPNLLKHMQVLCYKDDYGKPEEEQERRTRELREAANLLAQAQQGQVQGQVQVQRQDVQGEGVVRYVQEERVVEDPTEGDLQMDSTVEMDEDDIQTTEVILAIESVPEDGDLLVGHMVQ